VRAALTPQLAVQLERSMDREKTKPHSFLDRLLLLVRPVFQPKASDSLLTPPGVTYMLKTARPPPWSEPFQTRGPPPPGQPRLDLMRSGYQADDLDQFHAVVDNRLLPGRAVSLTLFRRGFLTWKVVALDLVAVPVPAGAASNVTTP
jgi:hypothetical protein